MKRILTAIVLIALVFVVVFLGHLWTITLFAAVVAELAAYEYLQLANLSGAKIPLWWMAAATAMVFVVGYAWPIEAQLPVLSAIAFVLFAVSGFRAPLQRVLPDTSVGLFGLVYIAYTLSLLPLIWNRDDGKPLLVFLMVCVWAGDIAALYIGKNFGSHKLAPKLSPGKTWEGSDGESTGIDAGCCMRVLDWRCSLREGQHGVAYPGAAVAIDGFSRRR